MQSLQLVPYRETAYPKLPASCTLQGSNTAINQVIPELLSLVLNPARATPQTPGTRDYSTCMPSKTHMLLSGKSLSNFKTKEVREGHVQSVRISLLHFSRKSLTLHSHYVMLLRQTVLEKPESPGSPASSPTSSY